MKIAFIHNNFPAGGAERVTIDVARYLSSFEDYNIYVYASRIAEGLMTDDIRQTLVLRKIPTQAIPSKRAKAIEKYILEDGIDVLVQVTKSISGIEKIKENPRLSAGIFGGLGKIKRQAPWWDDPGSPEARWPQR